MERNLKNKNRSHFWEFPRLKYRRYYKILNHLDLKYNLSNQSPAPKSRMVFSFSISIGKMQSICLKKKKMIRFKINAESHVDTCVKTKQSHTLGKRTQKKQNPAGRKGARWLPKAPGPGLSPQRSRGSGGGRGTCASRRHFFLMVGRREGRNVTNSKPRGS